MHIEIDKTGPNPTWKWKEGEYNGIGWYEGETTEELEKIAAESLRKQTL